MQKQVFGAVCLLCSEDSSTSLVSYSTNGLVIPTSACQMLGRFMDVRALTHSSLCAYLELIQCHMATNTVVVVSEHYELSLWSFIQKHRVSNSWIHQILLQVVDGVRFCHENLLILGLLTTDDLLLSDHDGPQLKIARYGLHKIACRNVDYVVGSAWYCAPERLAMLDEDRAFASSKSDVWSIGIVLLETFTRHKLKEIWNVKQILSILNDVIPNRNSILPGLLQRMKSNFDNSNLQMPTIPSEYYAIVEDCLQFFPSKRPTAEELYKRLFEIKSPSDSKNVVDENEVLQTDFTLTERFYLWNLCGQDVCSILVNCGVLKLRPPIRSLPWIVAEDFHLYGNEESRLLDVSMNVYTLPQSNLDQRIQQLDRIAFRYSCEISHGAHIAVKYASLDHQSLIVKERDIDYQAVRMCTMRRYLRCFPYAKDRLMFESTKDIPPVYRGSIWAALLDISQEEALEEFTQCDCISEQVSDRQLQVDIPRCHQYDELMATPAAHYKLKQILKSWLSYEKKYVYWQGLDSLAAPFLYLNFNNLPMAYACFRRFIKRYLREYLSVFMQLLSFTDAQLYEHLKALDFHPELFSIPWFLTSFAHVLPLHKLFHLWDSLLLADSSFPLFVGVSILSYLRNSLMSAQFNDAILLFSDLPDVPIDSIVTNSWKLYNSVPLGCVARVHSSTHLRRKYPLTKTYRYDWQECSCPPVYASDLAQLMKTETVLMIDLRPEFIHTKQPIPGSISCCFEVNEYSTETFTQIAGGAVESAFQKQHIICLFDIAPYLSAKSAGCECVANGIDRVCIYVDDCTLLL
ncbi:hypothetical protein M3Y98_00445300 [Aphelenchoides besseyi]|nr:hypothetical protein M3Y98_00445300 [Aphelenchoides besseyi]KAI6202583.1 hypothetical protein M3Y96_00964200 [Aphelenchoides besseyi]